MSDHIVSDRASEIRSWPSLRPGSISLVTPNGCRIYCRRSDQPMAGCKRPRPKHPVGVTEFWLDNANSCSLSFSWKSRR
jgi:hypothetical protein